MFPMIPLLMIVRGRESRPDVWTKIPMPESMK